MHIVSITHTHIQICVHIWYTSFTPPHTHTQYMPNNVIIHSIVFICPLRSNLCTSCSFMIDQFIFNLMHEQWAQNMKRCTDDHFYCTSQEWSANKGSENDECVCVCVRACTAKRERKRQPKGGELKFLSEFNWIDKRGALRTAVQPMSNGVLFRLFFFYISIQYINDNMQISMVVVCGWQCVYVCGSNLSHRKKAYKWISSGGSSSTRWIKKNSN